MDIEWNNALLGENNDLANISTSGTYELEWIQENAFISPPESIGRKHCLLFDFFVCFSVVFWTGDSGDMMFVCLILSHLDSCSHDTFYRVGPENKCFQFVSSGAGKQVFPVCTVWEWVKKETSIIIPVNSHFNPTWWSSVC